MQLIVSLEERLKINSKILENKLKLRGRWTNLKKSGNKLEGACKFLKDDSERK